MPKLPPINPRLNLVTSTRSILWRALVDWLKADPALARAIDTWRSWEGNPDDAAPPTLATMPWARLTPLAAPASTEALGLQRGDLIVRVELALAGLDATDILDLWTAFEVSLFPGDGTMQKLLFDSQSLGTLTLMLQGYGPTTLDGEQIWTATGQLQAGRTVLTQL